MGQRGGMERGSNNNNFKTCAKHNSANAFGYQSGKGREGRR